MSPLHLPSKVVPDMVLAVYGKHVGWDDHIEELGLDSVRLIQARQVLYVRGIGGAIESGLWDKLNEDGQRLPFHHVVVWPARDSVVVGRLWGSIDGKGRDRYPMLALTETRGLALDEALREVLPVLDQLETRCRNLTSANEVRNTVESFRNDLRTTAERLRSENRTNPETDNPNVWLARMASAPDWGPEQIGLRRTFHKMYREWADYAPGATPSENHHACALRVPRCAETLADAAVLWNHVLNGQIERSAPRMFFLPITLPWLDIVAGLPEPAQLYGLRASETVLAPAGDIPYVLDDAFQERIETLLDAARTSGADRMSIFGATHVGGLFGRLARRLRRWRGGTPDIGTRIRRPASIAEDPEKQEEQR